MAEGSVIRELVTLLGFDIDEKTLKTYEVRIAEARKHLRRMAIAAGVAGAAIASIAVKTARAGDDLVKTSQRLGLSIKALQEWRFVAERSGVATATFDMAMQRFGRRAAEAARGTGEAVKALAKLRVATKDANGNVREMDVLLEDALKSLSKIESPLERNALAMKLFDSEGVRVVQMLERGSEGIDLLRQRFRDLGGAIDEETAKLGVEAVDAWTDFRTALNGVIFAMGKELLPIVTKYLTLISDWLAKNQRMISVLGWATIGVVGLSAAVFAGIAAWKIYGAVVALVNAGLVLMAAKMIAIVALIAVVALLIQDVALFFRGGADTVTGRAVESLKAAVRVAIDYWMKIIIDFINNNVPAALFDVIVTAFADLTRLWGDFIRTIGAELSRLIEAVIPPPVLAFIKKTVSAGAGVISSPEKLITESTAQRLGTIAGGPGVGAVAGALVRITINQSPGQTAGGVVSAVVSKLVGAGVSVPLNGLAP